MVLVVSLIIVMLDIPPIFKIHVGKSNYILVESNLVKYWNARGAPSPPFLISFCLKL